MHVWPIKMRWGTGDNYAYVIADYPGTNEAVIIDPAEPNDCFRPLDQLIAKHSLKLIAGINTHHHYDHSGGNKDFKAKFPNLPLIGGKDSPLVEKVPSHGEKFKIGNLEVTALHTPCHTQDSICYYVEDKKKDERAVFTGDTLFIAGCGRFFEGTPTEMDKALNGVLASLPDDTKVYPGHEYTAGNLKFAKTILNNSSIKALDEFTKKNEVTTGAFTIGQEKKHNPFMMLEDSEVKSKLGLDDRKQIMAQLRELKNKM
ncbi:hypothetical protein CANCADRAFT_1770 [Tortispora caseinolytica NRRL Y-17796]|uniref:hydroxyacylglutathione hydrolase n=1 Tax=Tortispora caseinolytica NRRL Y-17796 TaxID=767744 RepID=A0A1E4TE50_9ASCO|nr:hypothetical protein CANCADRAFT_1770 [Tortispora caseinolytica NRRL Y-17796]